jgi:CHAT domain-containing protein
MIGRVLQSDFSETLLADAVAAIDRGGPRAARLRAGHLAYRAGRQALSLDEDDSDEAERKLGEARRELAAGESPMAAMAEEYLATAYLKQSRTAEALELLTRLRTQAHARPGYKALLARIQHDVALCEAQRGRWSASLEAATEALAIWNSLRDRTNAAASEAIVSQNYDFLGQRELAWKHGVSALRNACTTKHVRTARAALSALTRTEMRAGRWEAARSMARVEEGIARLGRNARPDAGLLLRVATIESHMGDMPAAMQAIEQARTAAAKTRHTRVMEKLVADVDAAAGAILRSSDPRRASELISSAIAYQKQSARQIVLPELYLERARAQMALHAWPEAEQDLDEGIEELEQQREHVDDAELRPGLFDSSAELFREAVSLQLQHGGDPARVLSYIERGRARAMLEQLGKSHEPPTLAGVQRHLVSSSMIIEYFSLGDRLVIVAVTPQDARVQTVSVSSAELAAAAADHARLYDLLIRPIEDMTRDARTITIVPDDVLQRVPFAALLDRNTGSFLIQRHTVATTPSAGVAMVTMQHGQHPKPVSALVFANPTIPRDTYPDLASLAASEREATAVAKRYPRAEVLKRDAATAERFLALAPSYDVVHFGGHAVVQQAEPAASALVCAASPSLHGALTLRQIAAMRFRVTQVVVLAACSTMTGRNAAIEGVPSLARAFVVAGVPAVVGTLWDIDDSEAAPLMRVLHEELAKGVAPADALRAAQLTAIREGQPVEQWAAFAVTGVAR